MTILIPALLAITVIGALGAAARREARQGDGLPTAAATAAPV